MTAKDGSKDSSESKDAPKDASFWDGVRRESTAKPLNLGVLAGEDLHVVSALAQDAVFPARAMRWQRGQRRFAVLLNRFRWEKTEEPKAQRGSGSFPQRVQSLLVVSNVLGVASLGFDRQDGGASLSLLSITFAPANDSPDTPAEVLLTLAGGGAIRLQVEALEIMLKDVSRPYAAPAGKAPAHEV